MVMGIVRVWTVWTDPDGFPRIFSGLCPQDDRGFEPASVKVGTFDDFDTAWRFYSKLEDAWMPPVV